MRDFQMIFYFIFFLLQLPYFESFSSVTLSSKETIVSTGNRFELGLVQPDLLISRWFLGLWYKEDPNRTCVWVANRDDPLKSNVGTLTILKHEIVLFDEDNVNVWSANLSTGRGVGNSQMIGQFQLQDTGNLVVKDSNDDSSYLWQSFDYPTDTLLPQMNLGNDPRKKLKLVLNSWKSLNNPSRSDVSLQIEDIGFGIFAIVISFSSQKVRTNIWNGYQFGNLPTILKQGNDKDKTLFEMTYNQKLKSRLTFRISGSLEFHVFRPETKLWELDWSLTSEVDECRSPIYAYDDVISCGSNAVCISNNNNTSRTQECICIHGFKEKLNEDVGEEVDVVSGCLRMTSLNCSNDIFLRMNNMKWPENPNNRTQTKDLQMCEHKCLLDCNCTAFAVLQSPEPMENSCITWIGELRDMQNYTVGGSDLYVRLAADQDIIENAPKSEPVLQPWAIGLLVVGILLLTFALVGGGGGFWYFYLYKRLNTEVPTTTTQGQSETQMMMTQLVRDQFFSFMDFRAVTEATHNFTTELGRGGFGIVYKGILENGTEVAVKRLKNSSTRGTDEEFKNEVLTVLNVRHKNLVRLLSCCCEGIEKILIYEFLENSSLDHHIFDEARSRLLNWARRFIIINEIAQGLYYLHHLRDSPIIHRDLKPSNILLDKNMSSKISDFGLSTTLKRGETQLESNIMVGTFGYMSEEYAGQNIMSEKSDIFSYGVTIMEIITGKKNYKYSNDNPGDSILDLAWRKWSEGNVLELIDSNFEDGTLIQEQVFKCVQIGLLCVQNKAEDRPTSDLVLHMLRGLEIPLPKKLEYYYSKSLAIFYGK